MEQNEEEKERDVVVGTEIRENVIFYTLASELVKRLHQKFTFLFGVFRYPN
jgi:hypothetical protein